MTRPTLHLVGFRGEEYWSARKVWRGMPVMIHRVHDSRMARDVGPDDVVIFANGECESVVRQFNADDLVERKSPPGVNRTGFSGAGW